MVFAVEGNHAETVSTLLKAGADVNQSVAEDDTPLHMAIRHSHHAIAMLLIQHQSIAINAKVRTCIAYRHLYHGNALKLHIQPIADHVEHTFIDDVLGAVVRGMRGEQWQALPHRLT